MEKLNCFQIATNIKIAKRAELREKIGTAVVGSLMFVFMVAALVVL